MSKDIKVPEGKTTEFEEERGACLEVGVLAAGVCEVGVGEKKGKQMNKMGIYTQRAIAT